MTVKQLAHVGIIYMQDADASKQDKILLKTNCLRILVQKLRMSRQLLSFGQQQGCPMPDQSNNSTDQTPSGSVSANRRRLIKASAAVPLMVTLEAGATTALSSVKSCMNHYDDNPKDFYDYGQTKDPGDTTVRVYVDYWDHKNAGSVIKTKRLCSKSAGDGSVGKYLGVGDVVLDVDGNDCSVKDFAGPVGPMNDKYRDASEWGSSYSYTKSGDYYSNGDGNKYVNKNDYAGSKCGQGLARYDISSDGKTGTYKGYRPNDKNTDYHHHLKGSCLASLNPDYKDNPYTYKDGWGWSSRY